MTNKLIKLSALLLTLAFLLGICTACQGSEEASSADKENGIEIKSDDSPAASAIKELYLDAAKEQSDIMSIATAMMQDGAIPYSLDVFEIEQGAYLNGFSAEPDGYSRGVCFCPFIGTIPFVGYLFESDNPQQLFSSLKANAMLDWNICTQADEIVSGIDGSRVLFVMTPSSFDD